MVMPPSSAMAFVPESSVPITPDVSLLANATSSTRSDSDTTDSVEKASKSGVEVDAESSGSSDAISKESSVEYDCSGSLINSKPTDVKEEKSGDKNKYPAAVVKRTADDFIFEKVLGEGSFSTVYLARDIHTSKLYAIKVCEKMHIKREKKETYIKREKEIMQLLCANPSPFFVKLFCTFHDHYRLYFVMTYAKHGEILPYLHKVGCFDADCTRFYSGEIILALEHLHKLGIIHRDLKPENILLNEGMHILITDFGSAKIIDQSESEANTEEEVPGMRPRRNSFVGTADYVSPELLTNKETSKSADLWALGCLVYQFLAGLPPFRAPNEYLIFQRVMKLDYSFPEGFNVIAKDLVSKLLVKDPTKRLGCEEMGGYPVLKSHQFYKGLDWRSLHLQQPPVITPHLPVNGTDEELRSDIKPGFDEKKLGYLLDLQLRDGMSKPTEPTPVPKGGLLDIPQQEYDERLAAQAKTSQWHTFVENHLILKHGIIDKRKGLFARRRMFLLTTGPHLYYVDPVNMQLKGEIPWSADMKPEPKNFKTFFVHTPNRTYYLEDPQGFALEWCKTIEQVRAETFDKKEPKK